MQSASKVVVIIPVYNGMPFLPLAVNSILSQTYRDFRLLIINDGSTDGSAEYLNSLTDPRVEVRNQTNRGLCATLNEALNSCNEAYIARLDQDDIALADRLSEQVAFLDAHPECDVVLSNLSRISQSGKKFGAYSFEEKEEAFTYDGLKHGCIVHSTMLARGSRLKEIGGYRAMMYPVDDYDLLLRLEEQTTISVLNHVLIEYRIHGSAGTFQTFEEMHKKTKYATTLAGLRRTGEPEVSYQDFLQTYGEDTCIKKWRETLNRKGRLMFRMAGMDIGEGKYVSGFTHLLGASVLASGFTLHRLTRLMKQKFIKT